MSVILSVDPSSTAIGWAVMDDCGWLEAGGVIRPDDPAEAGIWRSIKMAVDLGRVLELCPPDVILIEITSGKTARRLGAKSSGLGVYGMGVGAAAMVCYEYHRSKPVVRFVPVLENAWTRGVKKRDRQAAISAMYPDYLSDRDPGADLADAIGLAVWWVKEQQVESSGHVRGRR